MDAYEIADGVHHDIVERARVSHAKPGDVLTLDPTYDGTFAARLQHSARALQGNFRVTGVLVGESGSVSYRIHRMRAVIPAECFVNDRVVRHVDGVLVRAGEGIAIVVLDGDRPQAPFPTQIYRVHDGHSGAGERDLFREAMWLVSNSGATGDAVGGDFSLEEKDGRHVLVRLGGFGSVTPIKASVARIAAKTMTQSGQLYLPDDIVEARVLADYHASIGRVALVTEAFVFEDDKEAEGDWMSFDPPIAMRVDAHASEHLENSEILRWMDEGAIDPVYAVTALEAHPDIEGRRVSHAFARSYYRDGRIEDGGIAVMPTETQERFFAEKNTDAGAASEAPNTSSPWYRPV